MHLVMRCARNYCVLCARSYRLPAGLCARSYWGCSIDTTTSSSTCASAEDKADCRSPACPFGSVRHFGGGPAACPLATHVHAHVRVRILRRHKAQGTPQAASRTRARGQFGRARFPPRKGRRIPWNPIKLSLSAVHVSTFPLGPF
jgi:hypothetical protein